jgi:hypothetical protein
VFLEHGVPQAQKGSWFGACLLANGGFR